MNDEIKWVDAGRDTKLIDLFELFQVNVLSYSCHMCPSLTSWYLLQVFLWMALKLF